MLAPYRQIVLVGARPPVAFFAYPDQPGVLTAEGARFTELADTGADIAGALDALSIAVGGDRTAPAGVARMSITAHTGLTYR